MFTYITNAVISCVCSYPVRCVVPVLEQTCSVKTGSEFWRTTTLFPFCKVMRWSLP